MNKILYSLLVTLSGLILLLTYRTSHEVVVPALAPAGGATTTVPAQPSAPPGAGLTDGTFTGATSRTRYGDVQVVITVSNGSITAVDVPAYPDSNGRDRQINQHALPILVSETMSAQSASIDMVSGATYTSDGYRRSLQSAIDQARP